MTIPESLNRRNLFRAMLLALAFSALAGVAVVFLPARDISWRFLLMAVLTAVGCGLMMASAAIASSRHGEAAGLFGMALVVVVYTIAAAGIWVDYLINNFEWRLAAIAFWTLLSGLPLLIALRFGEGKQDRVPIGVMAMGCGLGLIVFSIGIVSFWTLPEKYVSNGSALLVWGVLTGVCMMGVKSQAMLPWRWIGVAAAAVATAMMHYGIWIKSSNDATWVTLAYVVAAVPAYMNVVRRANLKGWASWVRLVAVVAFILAGFSLVIVAAEDFSFWHGSLASQAYFGMTIVTLAATMGVAVLAIANRRVVAKDAPAGVFSHVQLSCPRCGKEQSAPLGSSACAGCRLRFVVRVQLPICPSCQYDLSDVRGENCPECGTAIPMGSDVGAAPAS
jgi:hypothetical protein